MAILKRPISFIAAAKSCRRPFIGSLIRGTGAIPVERPQDVARKGEGKIVQVKDKIVVGKNTKFTTIATGSTLEMEGQSELRVAEIISDFELRVDSKFVEFEGEISYKVIPKL